MGMLLFDFRYMPDGRPVEWPANFKSEQLKVSRLEARIQELKGMLEDREERLALAREDLREARNNAKAETSAAKRAPPRPERDDFQAIPGIGPVLEKKLYRLGIATYKQLAQADGDELEKIAARLGTSTDAIRRQRWQSAAARLAKSQAR